MAIQKSVIVAELRSRGLHMRADFVERQLPDDIDPLRHSGLLTTLNVDIAELVAAADAANPPPAN